MIVRPEMTEFYWFRDPMANRPYMGTFDISHLGEPLTQRALIEFHWTLLAYTRGETRPPDAMLVRRVGGEKQPSDAIWMGDMLVASAAMQAALAPFRGWTTFPTTVLDGWGEPVPGYAGIAVTGRCGVVRPDLTRVEGEGIHAEYVGKRFDPTTWDGSDIFYPTYGWGLIATDAVRRALKRAKIRNLSFERLDEIRSSKVSADRDRELHLGPFADEPPTRPTW